MNEPRTSGIRRFLELPFHPFLFGAYAVLFLWSQNVAKVRPPDVIQPIAGILIGTAVLLAGAWLLMRDRARGALLVTVFSFLFFAYGHVFGDGKHDKIGFSLWAVIGVGTFLLLFFKRPDVRRLGTILNGVFLLLVAMSGFTIVSAKLAEWRESIPIAETGAARRPVATAKDGTTRDVYFILLDRYAGSKTLKEKWGYDNSWFLDGLRKRGFYVALDSRGPYPKTPHSIQTTLNMDYLDDIPPKTKVWTPLYDRLKAPKTARFLKQRGYRYILAGSSYHSLRNDPFADVNLTYDPKSGPVFTEFESVLYDSTILAVLGKRFDVAVLDQRRAWYDRVVFQYRQIPKIAKLPEATYMFAHLLINHEPLVFDENGEFIPLAEAEKLTEAQLYRKTIEFSSKKTLELIDILQAGPDTTDPIIVLQSDEGTGPAGWSRTMPGHFDWTKAPDSVLLEKFRILNAYYTPGVADPGFYPSISPANSFRVIFNAYFDAGYPLLPDKSFVFHNELQPFRFIDVTERVRD